MKHYMICIYANNHQNKIKNKHIIFPEAPTLSLGALPDVSWTASRPAARRGLTIIYYRYNIQYKYYECSNMTYYVLIVIARL